MTKHFKRFGGHHDGPPLSDPSSPILRQYGPPPDHSNLNHPEASKSFNLSCHSSLEERFQALLAAKDPLLSWRKRFWERFLELGWPHPRDEAFQYIPAKDLALPLSGDFKGGRRESDQPFRIAFQDGKFSPEASRLPEGIACMPLDEAIRPYGIFLQNRLTRALKEERDPLALLNGALQERGAFLYVPPGAEAKIALEQRFSCAEMVHPRLMVSLGRGAKLTLEQKMGIPFCSNFLFDAWVDEGAELIFKEVENHKQGTIFQSIRAGLKRNSRMALHLYSEGAVLARTSIKVQLLEENSEALLEGLWRLAESRQTHIHTLIEHLAPHTRSRQHFKGVLKGKSRSSFEGKIFVHPLAQKTEAYQLNNNLILGDEAAAYAKPNLEILADDVKASHGATIGQLSQEDLFYLRSRGIPFEEANNFLIEGFCGELSRCLP